jgi:hypothetical protein
VQKIYRPHFYPLDEDAINKDYLLPSEVFRHNIQDKEQNEECSQVTEDGDR